MKKLYVLKVYDLRTSRGQWRYVSLNYGTVGYTSVADLERATKFESVSDLLGQWRYQERNREIPLEGKNVIYAIVELEQVNTPSYIEARTLE